MMESSAARAADARAALLGIGRPRAHYRLTDSTNERAKELALAGAPHGTLVTADEQTSGRGRQGRRWTAPPRSAVLMSLILRDLDEGHALLPLAAALAVADACAPRPTAIKWPNDVWIDGRKVAGILLEGRPQEGWTVLGIGLNVSAHPPDLPATSLGEAEPEAVLERLLAALERRLGSPPSAVVAAWSEQDALAGRTVRWAGGEGVARGIDDTGALVVDTSGGRITLDAGEVHLLKA